MTGGIGEVLIFPLAIDSFLSISSGAESPLLTMYHPKNPWNPIPREIPKSFQRVELVTRPGRTEKYKAGRTKVIPMTLPKTL